MAALMLPLPTESATEDGLMPSHIPLKTTHSSSKTHHSQQRQRGAGQDNLKWEGVIGSLTSATIAVNFEPKTDMVVVMQCPVSFESSKSCVLHCR